MRPRRLLAHASPPAHIAHAPAPTVPAALMLSLPDQLVHLSVHAHKHSSNRLIWLKDLDLLIRRHSADINGQQVVEIARAQGVTASVWYALELLTELLGTPADPTLLAAGWKGRCAAAQYSSTQPTRGAAPCPVWC